MENKNGQNIFLGVIGVATLVVAIVGATFAYFSASANSADNAISTGSTVIQLEYDDTTGTLLKTHLIPSTETIAQYAAITQTGTDAAKNNKCVDDNNNDVCSIYQFTVTNTSSAAVDLYYSITIAKNEFTNLKYDIYEGALSTLSTSSTTVATGTFTTVTGTDTAKKTDLTELNTQLAATSGTKTYTMIIWLNETNNDQNDADGNKLFAATMKAETASGTGVTGTIAAANKSTS